MKVQKITQNLQFHGFKNVVSHTHNFNDGDYIAYMGMEVNNANHSDLDTWITIQKDILKKEKPSNYIFFSQMRINQTPVLSVDNKCLEPEVCDIGSKEEKSILKIIDFLASLTKRISQKDFTEEDKNIYNVVANNLKIMLKIFRNDKSFSEYLTTCGAMKRVKQYKTAELINSEIAKKMTAYFKL